MYEMVIMMRDDDNNVGVLHLRILARRIPRTAGWAAEYVLFHIIIIIEMEHQGLERVGGMLRRIQPRINVPTEREQMQRSFGGFFLTLYDHPDRVRSSLVNQLHTRQWMSCLDRLKDVSIQHPRTNYLFSCLPVEVQIGAHNNM